MSPPTRLCPGCNNPFAGRPNARVCSSRCRKRIFRAKQSLQHEVQKLAELRQSAIADIQNSLVPRQLATLAAETPSDFGDDTSLGLSAFDSFESSFADAGSMPTPVHPVGHIIRPQPAPLPVAQPVRPQPQMLPEIKSLETRPTAAHWQELQNSWQVPPAQPEVPTQSTAPTPPIQASTYLSSLSSVPRSTWAVPQERR